MFPMKVIAILMAQGVVLCQLYFWRILSPNYNNGLYDIPKDR